MPFHTLISANDLLQTHASSVLIDCRHDLADPDAGRRAYAGGHLVGAVFAHLDDDLSGQKISADGRFRGRHPLPEVAVFVATLRRLGVNQDSQVVAYDAHGGMFAARLWWMLRWIGHDAVAVLDGGLPAWVAAGGLLSSEAGVIATGNICAANSLVTTVTADEVQANLQSRIMTLLDARAADRFRGENETLDRIGGHIPGAKNRFFKNNLEPDGRFKAASALRDEFTALIDTAPRSIMQCGSGVTACHNLLAMEVAGLSGAALYPGSWSEWSSDPTRPVAIGPA